MNSRCKLTGRLVAAGRALAGIGLEDFAQASGLAIARIRKFEDSGSAHIQGPGDIEAIFHSFEHFGVAVVNEDEHMGAGVRLKFTRLDTRQLMRLEGEGGIAAADDAP